MNLLEQLNSDLDVASHDVRVWEDRYLGNSPLTYLSPESREALGNRLKALSANFCRLACDALAERIKPIGFLVNGAHDDVLWERWRELGLEDQAAQAVLDCLISGRGFLSVWGSDGKATVTAESPQQCLLKRDPVSREVVAGIKRWVEGGDAYCVLYERTKITTYKSKSHVADGSAIPPTGWNAIGSVANPTGVVPLVQLTNRGRTVDVNGVSEQAPIADLNDALQKILVDAMVTSEFYARPRRWATGIQLEEDPDGNLIDPFEGSERTWISEKEDSKFGQFTQSDLSSYDTLISTLLKQIAALSGLPQHYLGLSDLPETGESTKAKEVGLVARADAKLVGLGQSFALVAKLMLAIANDAPVDSFNVQTVWARTETRSIAQESDAIVKLTGGDRPLLPVSEGLAALGYSPERITELLSALAAEQAQRAALAALDTAGTL
ncbi:hypothetical protein GCM10027047_33210 [Rhodococcus aerolatus]